MRSARFSPKPASIVDTTSFLNILNNVRTLQTSTKEVPSEKDYRLLITILFACISYLVLHYMWDVFNHAYAKDTILYTFVIITAVSK